MPICSVAPSSISDATCRPIARSTSPSTAGLCSGSGMSPSTSAWSWLTCTRPSPCVRGMYLFTCAIVRRAVCTAAKDASTDVPKEQ